MRKRASDYPVEDSGSPIKISNFNAVGGSTILYAGHFPRMKPSDFRTRTLDGVGDDWPIDYATLAPYWAENDRMMGVAGLAGRHTRPSRAQAEWRGSGGVPTPLHAITISARWRRSTPSASK